MTSTPEERLSILIDLSAGLAHASAFIPAAALTDVGKALGEQMRAVAAELSKTPVASREFKVGDRVRVVSNVDRLEREWDEGSLGEGVIIRHDPETAPHHLCWEVRLADSEYRTNYHSSRELELIEG